MNLDVRTASRRTEAALAAIDARDDQLHAFTEVFADAARARAKELDEQLLRGEAAGPLHGMPVSVKDLFPVAGSLTRAGSSALARAERADAVAVARLRAAGAVIIGKTAMHEFAMGVVTPGTSNPHDPARIAGGSSGGAAVAVAAGMGEGALGSDTRGSIRIPAALCGVVGLKPTFGAVPIEDAVPLSWSLDHGGPLAADVDTAAALYAALSGTAPAARPPVGAARLRAGVARAAFEGAEVEVQRCLEGALGALAAAGVDLADAARPDAADFDAANEQSILVSRPEAVAFHRSLGLDRGNYTQDVRDQLAAAEAISAADHVAAQRLRASLRRELTAAFSDFDVLLMPTVAVVAPPHAGALEHSRRLTRNVALWSFVGFPALSVPCGSGGGGLPVGLQIVARPHQEALLLDFGRLAESALR